MTTRFGNFKERALSAFLQDSLHSRLNRVEENTCADFKRVLAECESPIEAQFASALFESGFFDDADFLTGDRKRYFGTRPGLLQIAQQVRICEARVDFAFSERMWNGVCAQIIVECDGHDFHERTKAQAERDRSRDRMFQAAGWKVLRFTGSEIFKDALGCAEEVGDLIGDFAMEDHFRGRDHA